MDEPETYHINVRMSTHLPAERALSIADYRQIPYSIATKAILAFFFSPA
jgi:hypothetical protein